MTTRGRWAIAGFVVLLILASCGGDDGGEDESSSNGVVEEVSQEQLNALGSTLRNAATAQESYFVENTTYTTSVADLEGAGFNNTAGHTVEVITATGTGYCIEASVDGTTMYIESATATPEEGTC